MSDTGPILTQTNPAQGVEMGTITPYETANGRRYRARYRKPDRAGGQKRGFTTMREAKLYLSMVTVSKSKGEYIDPVASRVPVRMFADSWLRSKEPPMSKPSYYMTPERAWKNHVAPVWADREIWLIRRSEVEDWVSELATESRARSFFARWESSPASSMSPSMIVALRTIRRDTSAISLGADRASAASMSRTTRWRRWRHARRIRRWS